MAGSDVSAAPHDRGATSAAPPDQLALGIELGSTRIKACLVDASGGVVAVGSATWENQLRDGLWTYSMDAVRVGLRAAYRELADRYEADRNEPLTCLAAVGVSAMMHGYIVRDAAGELLVPFRTWRNTNTGVAARELSHALDCNIPLRWSVAHLYQAVLDAEPHVGQIRSITTLAGHVHELLTGRSVLGVGDAAGMFPVDPTTGTYDADRLATFDRLAGTHGAGHLRLAALLPQVLAAREDAGALTPEGAALLDDRGVLQPGAPACPPEGDAGTGMVATRHRDLAAQHERLQGGRRHRRVPAAVAQGARVVRGPVPAAAPVGSPAADAARPDVTLRPADRSERLMSPSPTTTTSTSAERMARAGALTRRAAPYLQITTTVVLLGVMLAVGAAPYPNFTSAQAVLDLLGKNAFLLPLAVGRTFVILSGGIDLSVGAVMALGSVIATTLLQRGYSAPVVIVVLLVAATILGLLVGLVISKFDIPPFIATLASMFLARGLCLVITDRSVTISDAFFRTINLGHFNLFSTQVTNLRGRVRTVDVYTTPAVLIALVLVVVAFVVLHYSRFGRTVYAVGGAESSAALMGLAVDRTKVGVYAISGLCAGISGLLFAFHTASGDPLAGIGHELNAIAVVVIGGTLLSGG